MYLQKSVYEYAPLIMILFIIVVFSVLAILCIKASVPLKKRVFDNVNVNSLKIERILQYYSYECYLGDYYMRFRETSTAELHRDFARAIRRALVYAGVPKEVIEEYEKRKVIRL